MSAYGAIRRTRLEGPLQTTIWSAKSQGSNTHGYVTIHHLDLYSARQHDGLVNYLKDVFGHVVDEGLTYPQEGEITRDSFEGYFFAADVLVAIIGGTGRSVGEKVEIDLELDDARAGRTWNECIAGFYYVKPNYPGRSSHICNAGFVVPPNHRGAGYGSVLAQSYLHYAPRLGYQASVFNLVYVNNVASVRLWERLNFTKAGLIPRAGRLKRKDGNGEEYVDAWVFYKSFLPATEAPDVH
ncbi:hypothetical protein AX16_004037 [Volvariella volvacea WC 439]|nr:hypothetical protein AX16_004037 [Volvariella volvacea WC 439]